jgi:hypothetical protein
MVGRYHKKGENIGWYHSQYTHQYALLVSSLTSENQPGYHLVPTLIPGLKKLCLARFLNAWFVVVGNEDQ